MVSAAARLARLHKLVQPDLEALPYRPAPQSQSETFSDDDAPGGISLEGEPGKRDAPEATDAKASPAVTISAADANTISTSAASTNAKGGKEANENENPERRFVRKSGAASSYNLGSQPKLAAIPTGTTTLAPTKLRKGEVASTKYFTPILALSKYPYQFCNKSHMQEIASAFFDAGKFWAREWDLYYVWDIEESKPLILVGETQFEQLLKEINSTLKLQLRITNQQREEGLVNRLPDHLRCTPRYLGRSHSRDEYDTMIDNVPAASSRLPSEPIRPSLDSRTLEDFEAAMEEMWDLTKNKNKATKEKKKLGRIQKQKTFTDQFKRAQRYLGLRPCMPKDQSPTAPDSIDHSLPAPFAFDSSVVFVCVDVESYERAHNKITEVGVATLDTRDLAGVAPGPDGANWRSKIRARHFRITDHRHLVNSEFVSGCPDRFDFGQSTFVKLAEAPARIAECFKSPFAAQPDHDGDEDLPNAANITDSGEQRKLILLGHDTLSDTKYLQQLGFDPLTLPNLIETQDTATMYRVWRREQQPTKLGNILYDFDIPGFNLHNAGNDAVYTVQAMLGVCVREATIRGSPEGKKMRDEQMAAKLLQARAAAKQQAEDLAEGWSDHGGDGGVPEPIVIKEDSPKPSLANPPGMLASTNGGDTGQVRGCGKSPVDSDGASQSPKAFRGATRGGRGRGSIPSSNRVQSRNHGRGRGHAHDAADSRPVEGFEASGAQVCTDLIDLS